jgi:hypothetical protein
MTGDSAADGRLHCCLVVVDQAPECPLKREYWTVGAVVVEDHWDHRVLWNGHGTYMAGLGEVVNDELDARERECCFLDGKIDAVLQP